MTRVTLLSKASFGLSGIPGALMRNGVDYFLLFYYSQVIGLNATLAGLALAIAMVFDAVSDPLIGYLSDNWRSRWGRRHPFMYAAIIPMSGCYIWVWFPPVGPESQGLLFAFLLAVTILLRLSMTVFDIPCNAIAPELTPDYHQRTELGSYRISTAWVAGSAMSVAMYAFWLNDSVGNPEGVLNEGGYQDAAIVAGALMFLTLLLSSLGLHREIPRLRSVVQAQASGLSQIFRDIVDVLKNRSMQALLLSGLALAAANGTNAAMWIYVYSSFYGLDSVQMASLVSVELTASILAVFFVRGFAMRGDKKRIAIVLLLCSAALGSFLPFFHMAGWTPGSGSQGLVYILMVRNFIDLVIWIMLMSVLYSLFADVTENLQMKSGKREEGVILASQTFINKSAAALGALIVGTLLTLINYPLQTETVFVSTEILNRLGVAAVVTWVGPVCLAAWLISKYEISKASHEQEVAALKLG